MNWDYVNIDDKGMKVDELRMKDINVAHVSPEHHFPIGLVMPVARRQELLNWAAAEPGRYIIEDDLTVNSVCRANLFRPFSRETEVTE